MSAILGTIPTTLEDAVRERKCILFVGSGLSVAAGYPSWGDLVLFLVEEARKMPHARVNGLDEIIAEKDYGMLAEFARSALAPSQFATLLKQKLGARAKPTKVHELIASTDYRGLITTNYDRLIETTVTLTRQWQPAIFTPETMEALAMALSNPEFFIFKLHGDVGSIDNIVLTDRDYDRLILRSPHVRSFLQAVVLTYTLLFVGYSLRDPDFQLSLRELSLIFEGKTPTHFAMLPDPPDFTIASLLQRLNIQAIPYSGKDNHREVEDVLAHLSSLRPLS